MMEILAPVGAPDRLHAAVRSGCDAVYLGYAHFNARRAAAGFTRDEMPGAVRYCHERDVSVYLTLNTLMLTYERDVVADTIRHGASCGVDGIIVQDLGVESLIRSIAPTLPLHASTQMAVHNVSGAKELESLGFRRAVLAREMTLEEIQKVKENTSIQLEVFVHGALCVSLSGQCYLSSIIGARSGNRGLCAQPCRLPMRSSWSTHSLSLKDLSAVELLPTLQALGVSSVKIEGRMKRPEYVAGVVSECRKALCGQEVNRQLLRDVFSRSGLTNGYLENRRGASMFGIRSREDVLASYGALPSLTRLYSRERQDIPLQMKFTLQGSRPAKLAVTDDRNNCIAIEGEIPQAAQNRGVTQEMVHKSLQKLGDTPYRLETLDCRIQPGWHLPVSAINRMRVWAVEELGSLRVQGYTHRCTGSIPTLTSPRMPVQPPQIRLWVQGLHQLPRDVWERIDDLILGVDEILEHPRQLAGYMDHVIATLPPALFGTAEDAAAQKLQALRALGVEHLLCQGLGHIHLGREAGMWLHGDFTLNALNAYAVDKLCQMGLEDITLSIEAPLLNIPQSPAPLGVMAYGYLPLMTLRNCPLRGPGGCGGCKGSGILTDRKGNRQVVRCLEGQVSQLHNHIPLYIGDKRMELEDRISFYTLYMLEEKQEQVDEILRLFAAGSSFPGERTRGMYYRKLR